MFHLLFANIHHNMVGRAAQVSKKWNELLKGDQVWESILLFKFPFIKPPKGNSKHLYFDLMNRNCNPQRSITLNGKKFICIPQRNDSCFAKTLKDNQSISISFTEKFVILILSTSNASSSEISYLNFLTRESIRNMGY